MAVVNDRGATSVVADLGINAGVIVGPELPGWRGSAPVSLTVTVTVDGIVKGDVTVDSAARDPLRALRFLINHCAGHGTVLPAGTLVSTGALTGVHDVKVESVSHIDFGAYGRLDVLYTPISGQR